MDFTKVRDRAIVHNILAAAGGGGSAYSTAYQAAYDAMTNQPSDSIATAQDTMVTTLVDDGVWAKFDLFYLFAQESNDDSEGLINWANPGTYNASEVANGGALTFTSLEGLTGDGSAYLNTNWNPSTQGVNYIQDDGGAGAYVREAVNEAGVDFSCYDGTSYINFASHFTGTVYFIINAAGSSSDPDEGPGMYILSRLNATDMDLYKNGSIETDTSVASNGIPNRELYIFARNNQGSPGNISSSQISAFFIGAGITSGEVTTITDAVEVYMDSNSKGIIP